MFRIQLKNKKFIQLGGANKFFWVKKRINFLWGIYSSLFLSKVNAEQVYKLYDKKLQNIKGG